MKHITYADKSLLVGDEAAETLTEYSAALARAGSADTVTLAAYGPDGSDTEGTFVLNQGTVLMTETISSSIPEPNNADVVARMREAIMRLRSPSPVQSDADPTPLDYDEL
jgi:hypothetical protein